MKIEDGVMYIGDKNLENFIMLFLKGYRFTHHGEDPTKIVIPKVVKVDGVTIEFEVEKDYKIDGGEIDKSKGRGKSGGGNVSES